MLSGETVLLRAAHSADAPAIAGVIAAAFEPYRGWLRPASGALSETTETIAERLREGHALVAEAGGRIVGCILIVAKSPAETLCRPPRRAARMAGARHRQPPDGRGRGPGPLARLRLDV